MNAEPAHPQPLTHVLAGDTAGEAPRRRRGRPTTGTVREIRIDDELWAELDVEAHALGIARPDYVRRILANRPENRAQ